MTPPPNTESLLHFILCRNCKGVAFGCGLSDQLLEGKTSVPLCLCLFMGFFMGYHDLHTQRAIQSLLNEMSEQKWI